MTVGELVEQLQRFEPGMAVRVLVDTRQFNSEAFQGQRVLGGIAGVSWAGLSGHVLEAHRRKEPGYTPTVQIDLKF